MSEKIDVEEELQKLGYWNKTYNKSDAFGTGPTKLAVLAYKPMIENRVKTILELGCGQGRDSLFFAEKGYMVTAIDFSENAINFLKEIIEQRQIKNLKVKLQDVTMKFNFKNKFDCVYSNLTLQFFDKSELVDIFAKVSKALQKNHLFIFSTKKSGDKYYNVGKKVDNNAFILNGITRYFFEQKEIENMLEKFFEIKEFEKNSHTNLDGTISVWWHLVVRKK